MSKIGLHEHFTYPKLLRFVAPTIMMMIFTSIYSVVDGFFISNFVGKNAFTAVNLIFPLTNIIGGIGFMLGTGGCAIVSKTLGEGDHPKAKRYFSLFVYALAVIGVLVCGVFQILAPWLVHLMKADGTMYTPALTYFRILLAGLPLFMLQSMFQSFFVTAEKSHLGFWVIVAAGCTNMVLDAVLVAGLHMGVTGAALATIFSYAIGAIIPLIYFFAPNHSLLRLGKTKFYGRQLLHACTNGISEFVSQVSSSIVGIVFNFQLLRLAGADGVAAYSVIMYIGFVFVAILLGYAIGTAPLIGFNHGAQNHAELKNLFRKSLILMGIIGVSMTVLALVLATPLAQLFVGYDQNLLAMTKIAINFYAFCFMFAGFNIFASSFFTALNNGLISAIISCLRPLVFEIGTVLILPLMFGLNGVWLSKVVADILAVVVALTFCFACRKKYHY